MDARFIKFIDALIKTGRTEHMTKYLDYWFTDRCGEWLCGDETYLYDGHIVFNMETILKQYDWFVEDHIPEM